MHSEALGIAGGLEQAFGRARPRRRLGLTPLIDVVFLLLVFFMLASRFDNEAALALDLASVESAAPESPTPSVRIELGAGGRITVDGRDLADIYELRRVLAARALREPDLRIVVSPEAATSLQRIASLLHGVRESGATHVTLINDRASETPHPDRGRSSR